MLAPFGHPAVATRSSAPGSPRTRTEGGFVLSLEFLLLLSIFMILVVAGLIWIQHWLIDLKLQKIIRSVRVYTQAGVLIGESVAFDTTEAPLILFRDPNHGNVLLGVKPYRFTSFQSLYFSGANCTGTAYIMDPNVGALEGSGMQALQAYWYAMGPGDGVNQHSWLYRTGGPDPSTSTQQIRSRWVSRNPDSPPGLPPGPCEDLQQAVPNPPGPPVLNPVPIDYLALATAVMDMTDKYPDTPYFIPTDAQEAAAIEAAGQALPTSEVTPTGPDGLTYTPSTGEQ